MNASSDPKALPLEGHPYVVHLGASWHQSNELNGSEDTWKAQEATAKGSFPPRLESFCTLRYEFRSASVDASLPGLVTLGDPSNNPASGTTASTTTTTPRAAMTNLVQVHVGNSSGSAGGILFRGKAAESKTQKATDCLLVFDGQTFRLEKCLKSFTQLRPVRRQVTLSTNPKASTLKSTTPVTTERTVKAGSKKTTGGVRARKTSTATTKAAIGTNENPPKKTPTRRRTKPTTKAKTTPFATPPASTNADADADADAGDATQMVSMQSDLDVVDPLPPPTKKSRTTSK